MQRGADSWSVAFRQMDGVVGGVYGATLLCIATMVVTQSDYADLVVKWSDYADLVVNRSDYADLVVNRSDYADLVVN